MVELLRQDTLVYVYTALALVCTVLWLLYRRRLRRSAAPPAPPRTRRTPAISCDSPTRHSAVPVQGSTVGASATWDSHAEVQQLLAHTPELRRLYAPLGYAPEFEQHCRQLLHELMALISTEVQDFAALYSTIHDIQTH